MSVASVVMRYSGAGALALTALCVTAVAGAQGAAPEAEPDADQPADELEPAEAAMPDVDAPAQPPPPVAEEAPAPEPPEPPPRAEGQYPPPYGYPPSYGYPPPQGYGSTYPYPPPPGYYPPPGYGYPPYPRPDRMRHRRPKPVYPKDAAVSTTPFFDGIMPSYSFGDRFESMVNFGLQFGLYAAKMVRIVARVIGNMDSDGGSYDYSSWDYPDQYDRIPAEDPTVVFGGSVGVVAVSREAFIMSPGLGFLRSDVSAYGSFVGASLPLEWVTGSGFRIGLEGMLGSSFGGSHEEFCVTGPCLEGSRRTVDRETEMSYYLQFQLGWGFGHPEPLPRQPERQRTEYQGEPVRVDQRSGVPGRAAPPRSRRPPPPPREPSDSDAWSPPGYEQPPPPDEGPPPGYDEAPVEE